MTSKKQLTEREGKRNRAKPRIITDHRPH